MIPSWLLLRTAEQQQAMPTTTETLVSVVAAVLPLLAVLSLLTIPAMLSRGDRGRGR